MLSQKANSVSKAKRMAITMGKKNLMMFKTRYHKALTLGDAVPAVIALALIAIVGSVALLILQNFQSNPVTTPSLPGGSGAYGLFIEANSVVLNGNIVANSSSVVSGQASGGAGVVVIATNSFSGSGTVYKSSGTGGDAAGGAGSNVINTLLQSVISIPFATSVTACTNNLASTAASGCAGTVTYTQSTTLTGNINATVNIVVNNGVTLTTNGWNLISASNVIVQTLGVIQTGSDGLGGSAGTQTTNGVAGSGGTLTSNSFGGTGAGGTGCFTTGGYGGNTITSPGGAPGAAGSTCTAGLTGTAGKKLPQLTAANTVLYAGGGQANVLIYLSGAGAGGSSPQYSSSYNGLGYGITGISTVLSFQGLLGLVIVAAIIIGVVVGAFAFGKGTGTREEF